MLYKPQGTCSKEIHIELADGKIQRVEFIGGCHGNLQGISTLIVGMDVHEVIHKLGGIRCGSKETSCPDQLATALRQLQS